VFAGNFCAFGKRTMQLPTEDDFQAKDGIDQRIGGRSCWLSPRPAKNRWLFPCIGVTGGDTITVLNADKQLIRVRISFIGAPDRRQAFGSRAKQAMSEPVFNRGDGAPDPTRSIATGVWLPKSWLTVRTPALSCSNKASA
jgi:hypothetical protein